MSCLNQLGLTAQQFINLESDQLFNALFDSQEEADDYVNEIDDYINSH